MENGAAFTRMVVTPNEKVTVIGAGRQKKAVTVTDADSVEVAHKEDRPNTATSGARVKKMDPIGHHGKGIVKCQVNEEVHIPRKINMATGTIRAAEERRSIVIRANVV
jgi:hypothetical protein